MMASKVAAPQETAQSCRIRDLATWTREVALVGENDLTDKASLFIRADAADIYAALTDGEAIAQGLPPNGAIGKVECFEPHVGGRFHMTLYFQGDAGTGKTTQSSDQIDAHFTARASWCTGPCSSCLTTPFLEL